MKSTCIECKNIMIGRSDKKFCSDQCRYIYNNKLKTDKEKIILEINSRLRKNRTILKKYSPVGKTTVRKEVLVSEKFDFRYYTHTYITRTATTYYFCYEYGYTYLPEDKILIVNWQPYMDKR